MAVGDDSGDARADPAAPAEPTGPDVPRPAPDSVKDRLKHLRERAERTRAGIEARRADSASIDTAFDAVERDAQTGGGVLAAAVAFRLFMFLVPYAFVMVTGFGLASSAAGQDPGDAARSAGIGGLLASAVASTSTLSLWNRLVALVVGGVALALTARTLVRVLWIVHRLIWRVETSQKPSPWASLILIGFVTVLFGVADLAAWLGSQSVGLRLLALLLTIVIAGAAWYLVSWWLPREECEWTALLPGAFIVAVGVGVLHLLTITYVVHVVSRKSAVYGAIGIALALLLWTYFAGRLLTAAIAANASLWKHRRVEADGSADQPLPT
jgi:membrane protein